MSLFPRSSTTPTVDSITEALFSQIMSVMGQKRPNLLTSCLRPLFLVPVRRMSKLLVEFDRNIAQIGFTTSVSQFLGHFANHLEITGKPTIPNQGPLMVICNHPAAYDVLILAAAIGREDLKVIASDIQLVQMLPHIADHSIPVPYHIPARLQTVRSSITHLKNGGALFLFPRGNVEPDPAVSPGAEQSFAGWSPSIELFLRSVPETLSVVAIASGVLSAKWFKNPIIKLWKKYEQRQKVAEVFQIASELLTGKEPSATPLLSFSPPLTIDQLGGVSAPDGILLESLISQACSLLVTHPHV